MDPASSFLSHVPWYTAIMIFVMLLAFLYFNINAYNEKFVRQGPTLFTMAGILVTFFGISIGLYQFDPSHVQKSLPDFLAGMRTAFWVSFVGVLSALLIKIRYSIWGIPKNMRKMEPADPAEELVRHSLTLHRLVGGDEPGAHSVAEHLEALRRENGEYLSGIRDALGKYLENMASNNSRALVEALDRVVKGFDAQLNSMTSESFRKLAGAIDEMVKWQDAYRETMPRITEELIRAVDQIREFGRQHAAFVSQSEKFGSILSHQGEMLKALSEERERLEESLSALGHLLESNRTALPEIEEQVLSMARKLTDGLSAGTDQLMEQLSGMVRKTHEQVAALDAGLERELTRSLEGLGQQLAALSQKFVQDYTPLTDKLREVVELANRTGR
jgi:hypothetical protein